MCPNPAELIPCLEFHVILSMVGELWIYLHLQGWGLLAEFHPQFYLSLFHSISKTIQRLLAFRFAFGFFQNYELRLHSPRLALLAVLRLEPGSLGILAPVCSSMGWLAASQSKRNFMLPLGDPSKGFVQEGNMLAIRSLVMDDQELLLFCPAF